MPYLQHAPFALDDVGRVDAEAWQQRAERFAHERAVADAQPVLGKVRVHAEVAASRISGAGRAALFEQHPCDTLELCEVEYTAEKTAYVRSKWLDDARWHEAVLLEGAIKRLVRVKVAQEREADDVILQERF